MKINFSFTIAVMKLTLRVVAKLVLFAKAHEYSQMIFCMKNIVIANYCTFILCQIIHDSRMENETGCTHVFARSAFSRERSVAGRSDPVKIVAITKKQR